MRIGLLAPEYSVMAGGMEELSRQLAACLAASDDLTIHARRDADLPEPPCRVLPVLGGEIRTDAAALRAREPDVWFALNAGYVQLAPMLRAPLVAYLNGNDFLFPWVRVRRDWLDRLERTRLAWRAAGPLRERLLVRDMRRGMRHAAGLVANSESSRRWASGLYPGFGEKMTVISPGVGDRFFQAHAPRTDDAPLRLLTVARLEQWTSRKNVDGVLRALALLPPAIRVHYTVAGDGDDRPRLEGIARDAGVADRVTFTGAVDAERLLSLYRESDLFIMASRARRHDIEGFGIVYLEASAAGTPVVCSRSGGATDAVEDGVNGVVLDEGTPEAIAAVIERVCTGQLRFDEDRVRSVAERHRWPLVAGRLRTLLAGVVAG